MHKSLRVLTAVAILFPALTATARSEPVADILITEIQTSSTNSASQEFIELYNNTDYNVDFTDTANDGQQQWKIQYFSSTKVAQTDFNWDSTDPTGTISLTGTIAAHGYFLLSTSVDGQSYAPDDVQPDQTYGSSHLADAGGGVQLVDVVDAVVTPHDRVGWSSDNPAPNNLYTTPEAGGSLQRLVSDDGSYQDSQGQTNPFVASTTTSPKAAWQQPPPSSDDQTPSNNDSQQQIDSPETLELTELLPNPAAPATDGSDEFVELYNYGDEAVELNGFIIQTGSGYAYSYTIGDETLAPHTYTIYTSADTPLSLANSGGQARLLDPSGLTISETDPYNEASEGEAWALTNETWQWTTTPTPGAANILNLPPPPVRKTAAAKKTTAKKRKKATPKKGSVKATKSGLATSGQDPISLDQVPPLHANVLAGIGGAALVYGAYEYRRDVANRFHQLRRYRATRRAARATAAGP